MVGYNIQRGGFLGNIESILAELATKNFIVAREKRGVKKGNSRKIKRKDNVQNSRFSISTILINSALKEIKGKIKGKSKENASDEDLEEDTKGKMITDERKIIVNGGYGTINKHYGISPVVKYADYNRIWGHLGAFRTYDAQEGAESRNEIALKNGEGSREMVSTETMDKAAKHFKYFVKGELVGEVGLVPPVGLNIDSKEWEKYRLMSLMSIYQPLIKLMRSMA